MLIGGRALILKAAEICYSKLVSFSQLINFCNQKDLSIYYSNHCLPRLQPVANTTNFKDRLVFSKTMSAQKTSVNQSWNSNVSLHSTRQNYFK
jgi:hypothetical protein